MCVCVCVQMFVHMYMCTCMYRYAHVCVFSGVCMLVYVFTHVFYLKDRGGCNNFKVPLSLEFY